MFNHNYEKKVVSKVHPESNNQIMIEIKGMSGVFDQELFKPYQKHEILPIDSGNFCGELLYGYSMDELERAKQDYKNLTGEDLDEDLLSEVRVLELDGSPFDQIMEIPYYWWASQCPCCGGDNNGVVSLICGE